MTLTRHHGGIIIVLSFAAAMLLTIIPLPDSLRTLRPDWMALTLIFWCLVLPYRVSVGSGFLVGLLLARVVAQHHRLPVCAPAPAYPGLSHVAACGSRR